MDCRNKLDADFWRAAQDPVRKERGVNRGVEARRLAKIKVTLPKVSIQREPESK